MHGLFPSAIAWVAIAGSAYCQTPTAAPAFDAASIKPAQNNARGPEGMPGFSSTVHTSPVSLTMRGIEFRAAVAWAYHVLPVQVTGPDWMDSARFDIIAKPAQASDVETLRAMTRTLLGSRFRLEAHRETKEMQAYILTLAKGGAKIAESTAEGESNITPDQKTFSVNIERTPVSQLVELLTMFFRAPVLDQTGLKGRYDIKLNIAKYVNEKGGIETDPQTLIVQLLQDDLGLKLEPKKTAVELVVVDKADKTPTEN